jgi:glycosyltransferase involved in cell wall biosynthesis
MTDIYQPKVSIITPTYNHERYIGQCIKSVLNQSYPNWEMLIIDDGSTDTTPDVVLGVADKRIKYYRQSHKGPQRLGETYNFALSQSSGELIAILEGDDFWPDGKLELQIKSFADPSIVLSFGQFIFAYDTGVIRYKQPQLNPAYTLNNNTPIGSALPILLGGASPAAVTIMLRKEELDAIGGFKQFFNNPYVDFPTLLELSIRGRFHYCPANLGFFRRHKASIMHNQNSDDKKIQRIAKQRYLYYESFLEKNREKIQDLNLSYESLMCIIYERKTDDPAFMLLFSGKELLEFGLMEEARDTFRKLLSIHPKLAFRGMAWAGVVSTYLKINICDIILNTVYLFQGPKQG